MAYRASRKISQFIDKLEEEAGYEGWRKGKEDTEARIIKLLEANLIYADWEGIFRKYPDGETGCAVNVSDIIALIKGATA